jgi:predicted TIM-barrel fold metal-dependent hydrolase
VHEEVLAICRRSQSRLLGFAGIDPRRPNAIELVARSFDQWGAVGLKLHPTGAWELGDERTHAVVSLAAVRGRPILVHIGHTMQILSDKNSQPEAFIRLARDFPNGKFIAGHSGFELFPQFLRGGIPENIFFDISGWQELVGDDAGLLKSNLDRLLEAFPGRVGFGTDSPFFSYNLISQEARWLAMVRRYVEDSPHRAQWRADEVLTCPAALRTAMRS